MITKNDIIKSARHLLKRSKGIPDVRLMHPTRDWVLGVLFASTVFFVTAGYASLSFFIKTTADALSPTVTDTVVTYESERVLTVLEHYRNKETQFQALRSDTTNRGVLRTEETIPEEETEVDESEEVDSIIEDAEETAEESTGEGEGFEENIE